MATNPKFSQILKEWQITVLHDSALPPLKCPYCIADMPSDAIQCRACSKMIGGRLPTTFSALRVAAVVLIAVAAAWLVIHFGHSN
jgi:hypothetical protein